MSKLNTNGKLSDKLYSALYHNKLLEKIFHTTVYSLKRDLKDCKSVLDLGCGKDSPLQYCKLIKYSVGVEAFKPSLKASKSKRIHSKYINENILNVDFEENSFDAVIMIEIIEHLNKEDAINLINRANKWAKKRVIITTPNGYLPQNEYDSNVLQNHLCGFDVKELKSLGFKVYGSAGLKILYSEQKNKNNNEIIWIRKPIVFWTIIAGVSRLFTYYLPNYAFELYGMRNKK
ncbi:MAG: class I SAM-dependent methyltransferase [bacterium]